MERLILLFRTLGDAAFAFENLRILRSAFECHFSSKGIATNLFCQKTMKFLFTNE